MSTDPNRIERRGAQRFEAHQPLIIHFEGKTVPGFIQDLSGRGIFFYAEAEFPIAAVVELTFTMPAEIALAESMPVRCRGRVLRASGVAAGHSLALAGQALAGQRSGIAVQLDSYQYLPASEPVAECVRVAVASGHGAAAVLTPR